MLVTLEELVNHLGNPSLETFQENHIENVILPGVQGELERYCGRPLEISQVREYLKPDCNGFVWFEVTPVHQIISVVDVNGATVEYTPPDVPDYVPNANPAVRNYDYAGTGYVESTWKMYVHPLGYLSPLYYNVPTGYYVTTLAGIDCTNDKDVKEKILEVAGRVVNKLFLDDVGMRAGSIEHSPNLDTRVPMWTEEELISMDRLRRRIC